MDSSNPDILSHHPALIANAFLYLAKQEGEGVNAQRLQKLVYFAHAWSLALFDKSVVADRPQAWEYGPIFEGLYYHFKDQGRSALKYVKTLDPESGTLKEQIPALSDTFTWRLLKQVHERHSHLSSEQLSDLAMAYGAASPWTLARQRKQVCLDDKDIQHYYREVLRESHPDVTFSFDEEGKRTDHLSFAADTPTTPKESS